MSLLPLSPTSASRRLAALLVVTLSLGLGACAGETGGEAGIAVTTLQGQTMGTVYRVLLPEASTEAEEAKALQPKIEKFLADFSKAASTWDSDSEISRFNASASTEWFPISDTLAAAVEEALEISAKSGGAFDPTILPLLQVWGFGPGQKGEWAEPEPAAVARARAVVGAEKLFVRRGEEPALRKAEPGVAIDVSAIAKGQAVDLISAWLLEQGCESHLVDIGGEMKPVSEKAPGVPWKLAIERPQQEAKAAREGALFFPLDGHSLATSGNARQFHLEAGRRLAHILDPRVGKPVERSIFSVSVLAPSCASADGWATALSVLQVEEALALAEKEGLAMFALVSDGGEALREVRTSAFEALVPESRQP